MDYLKIYNTLDSTNKEAGRLLATGPVADGFALVASHQTDGRGQMGRNWIAEPGKHLAMSIIHYPPGVSASGLPSLGMKVSLGIVLALQHLDAGLRPMIKWPNDIYLDGKKVCGILIENTLAGMEVQHSIIGIGMNINETHFLEDLPGAVSLWMMTQRTFDLISVAGIVREYVMSILQTEDAEWKRQYDSYLFLKGETKTFLLNGTTMEAKVLGVSEEGLLELQMKDNSIRSFRSNEIRWMM
jgi:BirA family biotin operon repressor/biotin-[acetyl-CoA-carboxylase] ligase